MNSFSWLIYLSDLLPSVASATGFLAFLLMFTLAGILFFRIMWQITEKTEFPINVPWKSLISLFVFLVTITAAIPHRNTILLIVASEYGEKVIESEVGGQALRILKNKLSEIELEQTRKKTQ
ncbi:MAG: hypothetical protein IM337_07495 [Microcystis sp. M110S1]|uniref:hypothetical protein n=1 Tax=Microcystis sp. M110S1 TaxID=2771102 RepID=UPI00258591AA|nr:hypothetical protein [Microcystis sp. M110S1]MCA2973845.1 hypothetical protein [Microcystis sp. M110S1]